MVDWSKRIHVEKVASQHEASEENHATGYWVEGVAFAPPKVGTRLLVRRDKRNGVVVRGRFLTTEITEVTPGKGVVYVHTKNSTYKVEQAND